MYQNRERLEIAYEILTFIRNSPNGAKPTHILFNANLSPVLLKKYLSHLVHDELVKTEPLGRKNVYVITDKGTSLIELLDSVQGMTRIIRIGEAAG